jgi:hypothetical protein
MVESIASKTVLALHSAAGIGIGVGVTTGRWCYLYPAVCCYVSIYMILTKKWGGLAFFRYRSEGKFVIVQCRVCPALMVPPQSPVNSGSLNPS